MVKRGLTLILVLVVAASLSGCATLFKKKTSEAEGLRSQISGLESQIQEKDQEISNLKDALAASIQEKEVLERKMGMEQKSRPTVKQIQTALKNAGFDPGAIDGKMGKQTKDAIKAFQKANGLVVDGRAGRLTWEILGKYLDKKVK